MWLKNYFEPKILADQRKVWFQVKSTIKVFNPFNKFFTFSFFIFLFFLLELKFNYNSVIKALKTQEFFIKKVEFLFMWRSHKKILISEVRLKSGLQGMWFLQKIPGVTQLFEIQTIWLLCIQAFADNFLINWEKVGHLSELQWIFAAIFCRQVKTKKWTNVDFHNCWIQLNAFLFFQRKYVFTEKN